MTFEEQAAELHRLEAVARSLGLSDELFEAILGAVTRAALSDPHATPEGQLAEIGERIQAAAAPRLRVVR